MSREQLNDFLHAAEHSLNLRKKLERCNSFTQIIQLASEYGFTITNRDIAEDEEAEKANTWFRESEISPFKNKST